MGKIKRENLSNDNDDKKDKSKYDSEINMFQEITDDKMRQIVDMGAITTNGKHTIYCINIIGQVEGHYVLSDETKTTKYEQIIPTLIAIEQSEEIEGVLLVLNTVGGDIEAGLAIAELVSGISKPTVSVVLGGGHSIGVPLAVSADHSFIVPSASMTIHPVRSSGTILGVSQSFLYFQKMQNRIVKFVVKNSNVKEDLFLKLMMNTDELATDIGSIVDGKEAVQIGLIDNVGSISDAINVLYDMIDSKTDYKK